MLKINLAEISNIQDIFQIGKVSLPIYYAQIDLYQLFQNKKNRIHIVEQIENDENKSKKVIGMMITCIENNKIHILSIAVLQDYRQTGAASKMINYLKEKFPQKIISLYVQTSNIIALNFYFKHQFRIKQYLEKYYSNLQVRSAFYMEYSYL